MKKTLFLIMLLKRFFALSIFGVFLIFSVSGCSSTTSNRPVPQQQGYNVTGGAALQYYEVTGVRQAGQPFQMGNTIGIANTGWPGRETGMSAGTAGVAGPTTLSGGAAILADVTSDADAGITVLSINTPVKQGEKGSLSVQGIPNTDYTVNATYDTSRGTMRASAAGRSGEDGTVNWTWNVKRDTLPGTYRLVVSGGGKMITATYTVK